MKRNFLYILLIILLFSLILYPLRYSKDKTKLIISFDLEYPYGLDKDYNLNKETWLNTIQEVLNIGKKYDIRFQFFVLGKTAEAYPNLINQISESGHTIACHSYSHKKQSELSYNERIAEAIKCKQVIEKITKKPIKGNRFPYTITVSDSFEILKTANYSYDSSLWESDISLLREYDYKDLIEFPLTPGYDDWYYYFYAPKNDSSEFYNNIKSALKEPKNITFTLLQHPWILALDKNRVINLDNFIKDIKQFKHINILTME